MVDEYAEARRQWRGLTEPVRVSSPAESLKEDSAAQSEISHQSPLTGDSDGERIPISAQSSTQILQEKYRGFLVGDLMKNVWAKEEQLKLETGKDLKALRNNFYHAVNNGQKEQALGALLALAENGQIRAAFGDDERFVKFWGGYLEKNTPLSRRSRDTSPKLGEEDIVATFRNDPAGAKFLAMFFKYILEQRLKLPAEQAVMIGMAVSNLARKAGKLEYQTMVYGDMESQKFQWNF